MAIEKRSLRDTGDTKRDRAAETFIEGRDKRPPQERPPKVLITHRIDSGLLVHIDAAARRRGISRAAWINFYLSKCVEEENS